MNRVGVQRRIPFLFPDGAQLGAENVVLHARARRHQVREYSGPLSIKTVLDGRVSWIVDGGRRRELVVDPHSFLILNAGETYSMDIDAARPVETCCVFFAAGYVERVALDVTSTLESALDAPDRTAPALPPYLSALHGDRERALVSRVQSLAPRCQGMVAPSGFEEDFLALAADLLPYYGEIREQAARIPALRASTREELFRRLLIGREFLHAAEAESAVSLETAARTACLSAYHFHRGFAKAFGYTPHEYLTRLRLERARSMIEAGSQVLEAGVAVGFSSGSAFSRAFRARYGVTPGALRVARRARG